MAKIKNNGIQSLTYVCLRAIDALGNERVLVIPSPSKATFSNGVTEQEIKEFNEIGELVLSDTYVTERNGTLALTYASKTKELLSVFFGLALANGTKTVALVKSIQVESTTVAAAASGYDGYGMTADQADSFASKLTSEGISETLTRVAIADFNPATADTWAQGADGLLRFATNLVTENAWVTVFAPYDSTNTDYLSETPQVNYKGDLVGVLINKEVFLVKFNNLIANLTENKEFDFGGGELVLNFRIGVSGGCKTFEVFFPNRLRAC